MISAAQNLKSMMRLTNTAEHTACQSALNAARQKLNVLAHNAIKNPPPSAGDFC